MNVILSLKILALRDIHVCSLFSIISCNNLINRTKTLMKSRSYHLSTNLHWKVTY